MTDCTVVAALTKPLVLLWLSSFYDRGGADFGPFPLGYTPFLFISLASFSSLRSFCQRRLDVPSRADGKKISAGAEQK